MKGFRLPGAVTTSTGFLLTRLSLIVFFTRTTNAISTPNAMTVNSAAKNDMSDAARVTIKCVENDKSKAMNVKTVATGCIARPLVHEDSTKTLFVSGTEYPLSMEHKWLTRAHRKIKDIPY